MAPEKFREFRETRACTLESVQKCMRFNEKDSVFGSFIETTTPKRMETKTFTNENSLLWTGPGLN